VMTVVVTVIVVSARRAPCYASNAARRQRTSYDGVRLVEVLDASIEKGIAESTVAIAKASVIFLEIMTMINSSLPRKPEGRTIDDHDFLFECAQRSPDIGFGVGSTPTRTKPAGGELHLTK
jgi:hypothetical protein